MKKTLLFILLVCAFCSARSQYKVDEGFEGATFPPAGWTTRIGAATPWAQKAPGGLSLSSFSAVYDFFNASSGTRDSLVTPAFTATVAGDSIKFDQAYATFSTQVDTLVIYAFNGSTYSTVVRLAGGPNVGTGMVTAPATTSQFFPAANQWAKRIYALPPGTIKVKFFVRAQFGNQLFIDNITIGTPAGIDAAVTSAGVTGNVLVNNAGSTINPIGSVKNNGSTSATFTVTRRISPGGYVDTQNITDLNPGATFPVTFAPWTYTSDVAYTVKDSVFLADDVNHSNDTLTGFLTFQSIKSTLVINIDQKSADSLKKHLSLAGLDGQYNEATNFPGMALANWRTLIVLFGSTGNWSASFRDSIKNYLDGSTPDAKRTLIIFGNDLGYANDPRRNLSVLPADTVLYRQYLHAQYWSDDWVDNFLSADSTAKGITSPFSSISSQRVNDPFPDLVAPATWNAGTGTVVSALVPVTESGDGDSCIAIAYSGNYETFYGTNVYANYVATSGAALAPQGVVFNIIRQYIEENGGQLPVELASFTSAISERKVTLNWSTISEENNARFEIERKSVSENSWKKIGNVNGAGNSNSPLNYSYSDNNPSTGRYNYRLKQVDYNGNFEYFNLANEVSIGVPDKFALSQNYPNPFNPSTMINYDLPYDSRVNIKIFDMTGREISSLVNQVQPAGYHSVNFNASNLASGVYFYQITADGGNRSFAKTMKMMLIK